MKVLVILGVLCLNDLGLETLKQNNIRDTWDTNTRLLNREGHEKDSFNSRFLGSLQVLILETNRSQWKPQNHSVHLQRISNSWVEWETSHCLHYYFIMLELLKKLSETESLNRRVQIITIQQQQRKRSYQIADLTFTMANSWRDECLMRFRLVPHPFPWFPVTEHRALSMPGKCFTSELTFSPQTRSHLDTLYSFLSSAASQWTWLASSWAEFSRVRK